MSNLQQKKCEHVIESNMTMAYCRKCHIFLPPTEKPVEINTIFLDTPPRERVEEKCECGGSHKQGFHFKDCSSPTPTDLEERFGNTKFGKGGGSSFECSDYEGMYDDLLIFLRQEKEKSRQETLDLIAEGQGWEASYDHYAKLLGLPTKYSQKNGKL